MNEQTRYRITGSLFVIALAVIFLPMLFDGAGVKPLTLPERTAAPKVISKELPKSVSAKSFAEADALKDRVAERNKTALIGEAVIPSGQPSQPETNSNTTWAVQVGSFESAENARKLKLKLEKAEYNIVLSRASSSDGTLTRVAIGPLIRESDAIKLRDQLSGSYREAIVVKLGY
jgi:DedD protein